MPKSCFVQSGTTTSISFDAYVRGFNELDYQILAFGDKKVQPIYKLIGLFANVF